MPSGDGTMVFADENYKKLDNILTPDDSIVVAMSDLAKQEECLKERYWWSFLLSSILTFLGCVILVLTYRGICWAWEKWWILPQKTKNKNSFTNFYRNRVKKVIDKSIANPKLLNKNSGKDNDTTARTFFVGKTNLLLPFSYILSPIKTLKNKLKGSNHALYNPKSTFSSITNLTQQQGIKFSSIVTGPSTSVHKTNYKYQPLDSNVSSYDDSAFLMQNREFPLTEPIKSNVISDRSPQLPLASSSTLGPMTSIHLRRKDGPKSKSKITKSVSTNQIASGGISKSKIFGGIKESGISGIPSNLSTDTHSIKNYIQPSSFTWIAESKDWAGELISGQTITGRILVNFFLI
ncbi:unnamed protein product [Gordionus sp. m RMFG-2023]